MQTATVNLNQSSCIVERATLEGRTYTNICTGQSTTLPYSVGEYVTGGLTIAFVIFFIFQFRAMNRRMRRF